MRGAEMRRALSRRGVHAAGAAGAVVEHRECTRCLFSTEIPGISFDADGMCSYCALHDEMDVQYPTGEEGERRLAAIAAEIKAAGEGKEYDCIVGVSGGCDSSYLIHKMVEMGLR